MDAQGFLRLVWPDIGHYIIATPREQKGYIHHVFDTIEAAAKAAESLDRQGKNVYFALASTKEEQIWDETDQKWHQRTKPNMLALKTFYAEVDVAKPGEWETLNEHKRSKKYETREEALAGVKAFCKAIGWPLPTLVSSGWGFHLYWLLLEKINAKLYEDVGTLLKRTAIQLHFKLDPAALLLTQVYRVVGTHNYKRTDDVREVELLNQQQPNNPKSLYQLLKQKAEELGIPEKKETAPDYLDFGESNTKTTYPETEIHFEGLLNCPAIKAVVDAEGDVPYQHWWHVGQVVRFAIDGREHFHDISRSAQSYDATTTDGVLDRFESGEIGPTRCDTFEDHVEECSDCPHRGKITSPIQLGKKLVSLPAPTISLNTTQIAIPNPPKPYTRSPQGISVTLENKDGRTIDKIIYEKDFYPVRRVYHEGQDRELVIWKTTKPHEGDKEITVASADMYELKTLIEILANNGIYLAHENMSDMRGYMVAYIKALQEAAAREHLFSRLGWRDDNTRFVLGNRIYHNGVASKCDIDKAASVATAIRSEGSLDAWKDIIATLNHSDFVTHQFALATAFGSPLMIFTGISGGIINMLGRSGEGKSTVQRMVNSVWGHPNEMMLPAERGSTYTAKMIYMATMGNLPVCAEEITDMPQEDLGALVHSVHLGQPKWGAKQDGSMRQSIGIFSLLMLSSSNSSMPDKIVGSEGAAAKALRIIEVRVPTVNVYSKTEFQRRVDLPLLKNYGLAGHVYMTYITKHVDKVQALVQSLIAKIDHAAKTTSEERIWVAMVAANIAGLILAAKCGLHTMSVEHVFDYAVKQIRSMRDRSRDIIHTAEESLSAYVDQNINKVLVVEEIGADARGGTRVIDKPVGGMIARFDKVTGLLWIAITPFKFWCVKNGLVYQDLLADLNYNKTLLDKGANKVLGSGTEYRSGQVKCLLINTNAPMISGVKPEELVSTSNVDNVLKLPKIQRPPVAKTASMETPHQLP